MACCFCLNLSSDLNLHKSCLNFWLNSLRPSDSIWRHRPESTLAQVMACCVTTPSHYLNQCWLIFSKVQWCSAEGNFTRDTSVINHNYKFETYLSKTSHKSPSGQWVKSETALHSWRAHWGSSGWLCNSKHLPNSYFGLSTCSLVVSRMP